MSHLFFSPDWCAAAREACNADEAMYKGFKDPATFTHRMEFRCADRDLATHLEWEQARIVSWTAPSFDESDLYLVISADLSTWQQVAAGDSEGGTLLLAGKITFEKGPMAAAIENGGAFNNFLLSWGKVDTDWNV